MPIRPEMKALYPKDWRSVSRRIRERAGNVCEWPGCGAPNGQFIERDARDKERWKPHSHSGVCLGEACGSVKVVLTVAHLDHDPTNNDESNLRAWCQLRHLRYDSAEHAKNAAATRARKRDEQTGQLALKASGRP